MIHMSDLGLDYGLLLALLLREFWARPAFLYCPEPYFHIGFLRKHSASSAAKVRSTGYLFFNEMTRLLTRTEVPVREKNSSGATPLDFKLHHYHRLS